jgi:hypothetical protein
MRLFEICIVPYFPGIIVQIIKYFKQVLIKLEFELLLDSQYYHLEWMKKNINN